MKALWAAAVAERVNALCAMAPSGMLARDGALGMGAQPIPANRRERGRPKLWSFYAKEVEGVRSGGWYNCRLQIGYTEFPGDADIDGRDLCTDGKYYVEVNLKSSPATAEIKNAGSGSVPDHDVANSLVRIPIGEVEDCKLKDGPIDIAPVVYKYV